MIPVTEVTPDFGGSDVIEELQYFSFRGQNRKTRRDEDRLLLVHTARRGDAAVYDAYDLGPLVVVEAMVQRAKARVANKNSRPLGILRKVYRTLIPEAVRFASRTTTLRVNPVGALQTLPFGALYDGKRFLVQRFQLHYMVEYKASTPRSASSEKTVLIVGSPAFQGGGYYYPEPDGSFVREDFWPALPPLRGASKEMNEVRTALSGYDATLLSKHDATEAGFRDALQRQYRIVHIATHGVARSKSKDGTYDGSLEQVALAFAQGQRGGNRDSSDDGWLTELEVRSLKLSSTELVVLSACETGLGTAGVGVQLAGLRRALLLGAGAHSVLSSLWKISDAATSEFMVHFYGELAQNRSRADALDEASRRLRVKYKHPYYWAAFQLHGETDPIGKH